MPDPANPIRRRYDRIAPVYEWLEAPMEALALGRWRRALLARVQGPRVLEAGVGTGKNLPLYPPGVVLTAVDLSPRMLARSWGKPGPGTVHRCVMDVERLALRDGVFDEAVATFLFCSVADPVRGLREVARVLRPSGRILLLEHVRPAGRVLGSLFDGLDPLVVRAMGPHINRDTVANVRAAGLTVETEEDLFRDIVKLLICRPK